MWAWMCDVAFYQARRVSTQYGPVLLKRGQLLTSERWIEKQFGLHRNTVRRLLQLMVDDGMIALNRDHSASKAGTIVSLVNYEAYQSTARHCEPDGNPIGTNNGSNKEPIEDPNWSTRNEVNEANEVEIPRDRATQNKTIQTNSIRGEQIPANWSPDGADLKFAFDKGFERLEITEIANHFKDHWKAKSGKDAIKKDWSAAWRNWLRKDIEFRGEPHERRKWNGALGSGGIRQDIGSVSTAVRELLFDRGSAQPSGS